MTSILEKQEDEMNENRGSSRLYFFDNLRVFVIILVVLHHVAAVYGAGVPGYYYIEPPINDLTAYMSQLVFLLVNQSWFMGALFLVAGYFTPGSFDRKGMGSFMKDRILRLGIPVILFIFVFNPISRIGWWLMPANLTGITTPITWNAYPRLLGLGPTWFIILLFIFSFGYAVWRIIVKNRRKGEAKQTSRLRYLPIGIFVLGLAGGSFLLRMVIPIGKSVLHFPTLAYLPQYLSFFVLGIFAYRRSWLQTLTGSKGLVGFCAVILSGVLLFPLAFSGRFFSLKLTAAFGNALGNGQWQSAIYALWDSVTAVGMCLGLVVFFRRFCNRQRWVGSFLSHQSYAVYIVHIPIIVFLAYFLRNIALASLLKFGMAAIIVVPVCFTVAYIIRKIPGVAKIL